jgi:hypothetical protein
LHSASLAGAQNGTSQYSPAFRKIRLVLVLLLVLVLDLLLKDGDEQENEHEQKSGESQPADQFKLRFA